MLEREMARDINRPVKKILVDEKKHQLINYSKALLEYSMMYSQAVSVNNDCLDLVLEYCLPAFSHIKNVKSYAKQTIDDVLHKYNSTGKDREVVAINFNTVEGMKCVTFVFNDEEMPCSADTLEAGTYAFCYVLNTTAPEFSELGECYFKNGKRLS